jgi:hypothetical protein
MGIKVLKAYTNIDEGNWLEMHATDGEENGSVSMPLSFLPELLQAKAKCGPVPITITIAEDASAAVYEEMEGLAQNYIDANARKADELEKDGLHDLARLHAGKADTARQILNHIRQFKVAR